MEWVTEAFAAVHTWLFETVVQPALYAFGLIGIDESAFAATEWFLFGVVEIAVLYALLRPLEAAIPAEHWSDRRGVGIDVLYTFINRLGVVPLGLFALLTPLADWLQSSLGAIGFQPFHIENFVPGLGAVPFVVFVIYLVVLDLAEYWRHRLSHRFEWWWSLHALHHSQRRMSFWTDNRNHLLDDFTQALWSALIALAIGIPPGQFFLAIIFARMIESLSHANIRLPFGAIGERLIVSPRFHRRHHAIGFGHEGAYRGCNFAVLFPIWDILLRTADFRAELEPTGIRDQLTGRDYGAGFWRQQWLGARTMAHALRRNNGV